MFRDTLLESAAHARKAKRWPMTLAFVLESLAAGVIVTAPLLSTGVIPVSATPPRPTPLQTVRVAHETSSGDPRPNGGAVAGQSVVPISNRPDTIPWGKPSRESSEPIDPRIPGTGDGPPNVFSLCNGNCQPVVPERPAGPRKPSVVSHLSEAMLVHRVEPIYPRPAIAIHLSGEVKLHAIIARDGSIQSLSVISGHPLLATAAVDAVRQWRYRPYLLNGEAVEVETWITVNFRPSGN